MALGKGITGSSQSLVKMVLEHISTNCKLMIRNKLKKNTQNRKTYDHLIDEFLSLQNINDNLSELSPIEKAKFEQDIAISHLYYSSKIEGIKLDITELSYFI